MELAALLYGVFWLETDRARHVKASDPPDLTPTRNGVPLLPARPGERPVSRELVNRLRDQE